jgi:hypothetical protein
VAGRPDGGGSWRGGEARRGGEGPCTQDGRSLAVAVAPG